jgi:hypothetical protein
MSEREDYRAGRESRREAAAAPASTLRHDDMIRRRLGSAFYDVVRPRRDHSAPHAQAAEERPPAEGDDGD